MAENITFRLLGTTLPDGEITFAALGVFVDAFQELSTRVGRHLAGQAGPGRTAAAAERATRLRLRALGPGSTRLVVAVGEDQSLSPGDDLEDQAVTLLWDLFEALGGGQPPAWVNPLVARSAIRVVDALEAASASCEISSGSRPRRMVRVAPAAVDRRVWNISPPTAVAVPETYVSGILDLVDLRSRRFRIRDDVGNDIAVEDVGNAGEASRLVGSRVTAVGEGVLGRRGQVVKLMAAHVSDGSFQDIWRIPEHATDHLDLTLSPPPDGIDGLTDEEIAAFLDAIRK
jgi:hypothetical protein